MLYAKVVLALPVAGPFDYLVPPEEEKKVLPGMRAWVNFRGKKEIGYIVGLAGDSEISLVKPIIKLADHLPVLGQNMLKLTRMVSGHYCVSWGEVISASLPEQIRKGKPLPGWEEPDIPAKAGFSGLLLLDQEPRSRWEVYCRQIKETLEARRSIIVLVADKEQVLKARQEIIERIGQESETYFRQKPNETEEWLQMRSGRTRLVVGTRSSVFAPLSGLGLIIVDEETDSAYKQDQSPHYHGRQVALIRAELESCRIILGGNALSLEAIDLARTKKLELRVLPRQSPFPEIRIVDMKNLPFLDRKKNLILSRLLQDSLVSILAAKGKALIFLNRKGYATAAVCSTCARTMKCPHCNTNLVYFFDQGLLRCNYCSYKIPPPRICPSCNSGYIKFSGAGTQKLESELARIFPQARIKRIESAEIPRKEEADIFISAQGIIRNSPFLFDLTAVLGIDNSLNHVDFRASEKAFNVLLGLLAITGKQMFVQTSLPGHCCFQAMVKNDLDIFYDQELKSRRQVRFPPYRHFCQVRLRGKVEAKVEAAGSQLFQKLAQPPLPKGLELVSFNPGQPPKLRGNYYWVILIAAGNIDHLNRFLKINLKDFRQSGIIVTVDVDPV